MGEGVDGAGTKGGEAQGQVVVADDPRLGEEGLDLIFASRALDGPDALRGVIRELVGSGGRERGTAGPRRSTTN